MCVRGWGCRSFIWGVQEGPWLLTIIFELLYSPVVAVTLFYLYIFMLEGEKKKKDEDLPLVKP